MRIIVDTREQRPLPFRAEGIITQVRHEALDAGDYACEFEDGKRAEVVFERKSLSDLFGTMTSGYKRFKAEMERAKAAGTELVVVVEASVAQVALGAEHSTVSGESIVTKLFTLRERYGLETVFVRSRDEATYYMMHRWMAIGRERTRNGRNPVLPVSSSGVALKV